MISAVHIRRFRMHLAATNSLTRSARGGDKISRRRRSARAKTLIRVVGRTTSGNLAPGPREREQRAQNSIVSALKCQYTHIHALRLV